MLVKAVMKQDAWAAESRTPFCTLDKHYTCKTKTETNNENKTSLYNMSQFANLKFSHLISF